MTNRLHPTQSLAFETLLAQYHKEVWDGGEDGGAYDAAGVKTAKQLIGDYQHLQNELATCRTLLEELVKQHVEAGTDYIAAVGNAKLYLAKSEG